jgi:hypothetical protein
MDEAGRPQHSSERRGIAVWVAAATVVVGVVSAVIFWPDSDSDSLVGTRLDVAAEVGDDCRRLRIDTDSLHFEGHAPESWVVGRRWGTLEVVNKAIEGDRTVYDASFLDEITGQTVDVRGGAPGDVPFSLGCGLDGLPYRP